MRAAADGARSENAGPRDERTVYYIWHEARRGVLAFRERAKSVIAGTRPRSRWTTRNVGRRGRGQNVIVRFTPGGPFVVGAWRNRNLLQPWQASYYLAHTRAPSCTSCRTCVAVYATARRCFRRTFVTVERFRACVHVDRTFRVVLQC